MNVILKDMLSRRRDRSIAIVLAMKERDCDGHLPRDASAKLRKVVLDQFNEFADFAIDVCNSLDTEDVVLNEDWLMKLDEIHQVVTNGKH